MHKNCAAKVAAGACLAVGAMWSGQAVAAAPPAPTPPLSLVDQVMTFIDLGGPIIAVLLVVSVFGLAVSLVKIVQFVMVGASANGFVAPAAARLRQNDYDGGLAAIGQRRGPVAAVMRAAIAGRRTMGEDRIVREEVERIAQAQIDSLESGLSLIGLVAMVSPLLGLLGTVTGLIEAFQALAAAGDRVDPAILASGIWEALLTTVMGLAIGIPAAIIHTLLQRTVDSAAKRMEDAATQVFTVDLYRAQAEQAAA
jgi:biopolymer transport protein ExbB